MSKRSKQRKAAKQQARQERKQAGGGLHGLAVQAMSRMRFSLTFRIAVHYCARMIRTSLRSCLLMTLVLTVFFGGCVSHDVHRIARGIPGADGVYEQNVIQNPSITAYVTEEPLPPDGIERFVRRCKGIFGGILQLNMTLYDEPVYLKEIAAKKAEVPETADAPNVGDENVPSSEAAVESEVKPAPVFRGNTVVVKYDLMQVFRMWLFVMAGMVVCDILRMIHFVRHNNQLDKSVLAPIRDITELAATLSGTNLSNRINIAGTKNELKDLAVVINSMLDRIERSYNSQKQFVSDASHELRTPIAVIQGYVNMLQRWGKEDKTVLDEGLSAISQETESMKNLVENLLFLARHDKKTLMMEMEEFDPCDVVAELHKEAAMVTPEDQFIFEQRESCIIKADRGLVKQVMRILLDNAVKYTPKGGIITMGVTRTDDGCVLTMQDNGPGIAGDELPKIFDRFYRSDKARKAENGGHGLGLSIARIIVVAHGGKIRVRSKLGEGTTFYVQLPSQPAEKKPEAEKNEDPAAAPAQKKIRGFKRKEKTAEEKPAA